MSLVHLCGKKTSYFSQQVELQPITQGIIATFACGIQHWTNCAQQKWLFFPPGNWSQQCCSFNKQKWLLCFSKMHKKHFWNRIPSFMLCHLFRICISKSSNKSAGTLYFQNVMTSTVLFYCTVSFKSKETCTFVSTPLGELDVIRVWLKYPNSPPTGPLRRRGFVSALGQTGDLGGRSSHAGVHDAGFDACNNLRITSACFAVWLLL